MNYLQRRRLTLVSLAALFAAVSRPPKAQPSNGPGQSGADRGAFAHGTLEAGGVRLHYVEAGPRDGAAVVLVPGWPETWYAWRRVMPLLASAGRRAIAFDPPGLGESAFLPQGQGYDTGRIADVLRAGLHALALERVDLVGHDVGCWIAYAYATRHPDAVRRLVLLEAALPGVTPDAAFALANAPKVFQFYLNAIPELPELLTRGKERAFLAWLFRAKAANPDAIGPADLDEYMRSYGDPARMSAGFSYYRAVPADVAQNRAAPSLPMPILALGGEKGVGTALRDALRGHAEHLVGGMVEGYGHYLPEECPEELTRRILAFLDGGGP